MKSRRLIGGASHGPDTLKVLFKAFDDAWEMIAPTITGRAGAIEAKRLKLATIILSLAHDDPTESDEIKNAALASWGLPIDRNRARTDHRPKASGSAG